MPANPYKHRGHPPTLVESVVCVADLLGYSQMSRDSLHSGSGNAFLRRIHKALTSAYSHMRARRADTFGFKVFTDNVVVGYPLRRRLNHGEPELAHIVDIFGELQVRLAMEGFFLRGGIAVGEMYMDREVVLGDALLEAVEMDKSGGPPRLALCESALHLLRDHLDLYANPIVAPQNRLLLADADGVLFVDYLQQGVAAFPEGGVFFDVFKRHRDEIQSALATHQNASSILKKYEWAAAYHNFFCDEFASEHSCPGTEHVDEYASACELAQSLHSYAVPSVTKRAFERPGQRFSLQRV